MCLIQEKKMLINKTITKIFSSDLEKFRMKKQYNTQEIE